MPNHVTHKITFPADRATEVFDVLLNKENGGLEFGHLIPQPPELYHGDLSGEDDKDFECTWLSWNRKHWGTKWGAYSTKHGVEGDKAWIEFDTAWSVPYPFLSAFNNRFQMPFEHRYYDEGANFWGIETWGPSRHGAERLIVRLDKRRSDEKDRKALCIELKRYDPDATEDAA